MIRDRTLQYRTSPTNDPDTTHFVLCDYGRHGQQWIAIDPGMTDGALVKLICEGQIDNHIVRIIAVNPTTGTSQDVTDQIGALVFYTYDSQGDGFAMSKVERDLCERAGFDPVSAQEAWEAAQTLDHNL